MKQFWTVLKFELGNYFKNKGFVMTTVLIAVILSGVIIVPTFFMGNSKSGDSGEHAVTVAVADEAGVISDRGSGKRLSGPGAGPVHVCPEEPFCILRGAGPL